MAPKKHPHNTTKALVPSRKTAPVRSSLDALATIPEEAVWLESRKRARTRRAYRTDVAHFMHTFNITSPAALRKIDHRAVYAWERQLREVEGKEPRPPRPSLLKKPRPELLCELLNSDCATYDMIRNLWRILYEPD